MRRGHQGVWPEFDQREPLFIPGVELKGGRGIWFALGDTVQQASHMNVPI